jgi:hypothetical protein
VDPGNKQVLKTVKNIKTGEGPGNKQVLKTGAGQIGT